MGYEKSAFSTIISLCLRNGTRYGYSYHGTLIEIVRGLSNDDIVDDLDELR